MEFKKRLQAPARSPKKEHLGVPEELPSSQPISDSLASPDMARPVATATAGDNAGLRSPAPPVATSGEVPSLHHSIAAGHGVQAPAVYGNSNDSLAQAMLMLQTQSWNAQMLSITSETERLRNELDKRLEKKVTEAWHVDV